VGTKPLSAVVHAGAPDRLGEGDGGELVEGVAVAVGVLETAGVGEAAGRAAGVRGRLE